MEDGLTRHDNAKTNNKFLQEWLFFGLLAHVTNQDIDYRQFFNFDSTLSTRSLPQILQKWAADETQKVQTCKSKTEKSEIFNRYLRASTALADARRFVSKHCSCKRLDRISPDHGDSSPRNMTYEQGLDTSLTLSLAILGETLQEARPDMSSLFNDHKQFWTDSADEETSWGYSTYCRDEMKKSGLCLLEIRRMEAILPSVSVLYYASSMKHARAQGETSQCTVKTCCCRGREKSMLRPCTWEDVRTASVMQSRVAGNSL